ARSGRRYERNQCDALRQPQLQFHPRHWPGRWHHARAPCHGSQPISSGKAVPEFIADAKANPGKINSVASAGMGIPGHAAGELFKMMTGVDIACRPVLAIAAMRTR